MKRAPDSNHVSYIQWYLDCWIVMEMEGLMDEISVDVGVRQGYTLPVSNIYFAELIFEWESSVSPRIGDQFSSYSEQYKFYR